MTQEASGTPRNFNKLVISRRYRLIYCPIPKVACTTVKSFLRKSEGFSDFLDIEKAHDVGNNGLTIPPMLSEPEREDILGPQSNYYAFVFVRNPYTRLLSAYKNKVESIHTWEETALSKYWRELVSAMRNEVPPSANSALRPVGFEEFVELVDAIDFSTLDEHITSQVSLACLTVLQYDFIGRFESLETDFALVIDALGMSGEISAREQFPGNVTDASALMDCYYNSRLRRSVSEKFQADFEAFGYDI